MYLKITWNRFIIMVYYYYVYIYIYKYHHLKHQIMINSMITNIKLYTIGAYTNYMSDNTTISHI